MIDINFYIESYQIQKQIEDNRCFDKKEIFIELEKLRSKEPVVYNIETTNACNMKCKMCPRTTMMTRDISTMNVESFLNIINQLRPWTSSEWGKWEHFVETTYGINRNDMSENHFFLYIIPKVIQLHGYGDPLLDKNMHVFVKLLKERGLFSYFSCNPANIDIEKTMLMFDNGLDYIKYSIESVDDASHKEIRGESSNFLESYNNILKLLELKRKNNYKTIIIITMLDLNRKNQQEDYKKLKEAFNGLDVYLYLKSEDQQWYREDYHQTNSIHWSEFCKHPWMSLTIKSNCEVAMCMEDYNNEIILGNSDKSTLYEIWNGQKYNDFRIAHLEKNGDLKCHKQCDMSIVGDYIERLDS